VMHPPRGRVIACSPGRLGALLFGVILAVSSMVLVPVSPASASPVSAKSSVCDPAHLGDCPSPGTYIPDSTYQIAHENGFWITWAWNTVEQSPSGEVPQFIHVNVKFRNTSSQTEFFTCQGVEDPALAKEWIRRDGKDIGYIPADHTLCSDHPDATFTVAPGEEFVSWARFHNVPWRGDRVAIEWGPYKWAAPGGDFADPYWRKTS
jgi:hypothetical protein